METAQSLFDQLRQYLTYCPSTGELTWKAGRFAGKRAFKTETQGYLRGFIFRKRYMAHRVIWAMHHNEWPIEIDHINGNTGDNRIENLRSVTHSQNLKNSKRHCNNTSGVSGVSWSARYKKWTATLRSNDKTIFLGSYPQKAEAISVRKLAEEQHGYHSNHGRT